MANHGWVHTPSAAQCFIATLCLSPVVVVVVIVVVAVALCYHHSHRVRSTPCRNCAAALLLVVLHDDMMRASAPLLKYHIASITPSHTLQIRTPAKRLTSLINSCDNATTTSPPHTSLSIVIATCWDTSSSQQLAIFFPPLRTTSGFKHIFRTLEVKMVS